MGYGCTVVAPSLIPHRPGDRVKTNRRDALCLARLLRAAELTAVWVPDETHEAVRDLVRTRAMAVEDYRRHRQHISSFLLRHGRAYHRIAAGNQFRSAPQRCALLPEPTTHWLSAMPGGFLRRKVARQGARHFSAPSLCLELI